MWWFTLSIIAFFLLGFAAVVDKFLLSKSKIVPLSYAVYNSILAGALISLLIFFEKTFFFPREHIHILIISGAAFFFALYFMFIAVRDGEVSKVNPLITCLSPLLVFVLSFFLSIQSLSWLKFLGVLLLIMASYSLSQVGQPRARLNKKAWLFLILACGMFALNNSLNKLAYDSLPFITAFVWMRWATLVTAVVYTTLVWGWPTVLNQEKGIYSRFNKIIDWTQNLIDDAFEILGVKIKTDIGDKYQWPAFFIGQAAGGLGVILMQYAIKLGNVILVTALNGMQFFFVILIVYVLSKFFPQFLKENMQKKYLGQKIIWSLVLTLGVVLILI
ncbi:MAG: EamA family transporter [Patescibacteria group bacterium]|nr:EamA family transporter [Patescibacteria group bacterium]